MRDIGRENKREREKRITDLEATVDASDAAAGARLVNGQRTLWAKAKAEEAQHRVKYEARLAATLEPPPHDDTFNTHGFKMLIYEGGKSKSLAEFV